ncbi:MAG: DNA N-6-adenine-methyltransferase [Candidatus Saccharibacteria bacterium]
MTRQIRTDPTNAARQEWRTPRKLAAAIVERWKIGLDACARAESAVCRHYIGPDVAEIARHERNKTCVSVDALDGATPWAEAARLAGTRAVFCNPPFKQSLAFIACGVAAACNVDWPVTAVFLLPANMDTKWFAALVSQGAELYAFRGRVKYEPPPSLCTCAPHTPPGMPVQPHFHLQWCPLFLTSQHKPKSEPGFPSMLAVVAPGQQMRAQGQPWHMRFLDPVTLEPR